VWRGWHCERRNRIRGDQEGRGARDSISTHTEQAGGIVRSRARTRVNEFVVSFRTAVRTRNRVDDRKRGGQHQEHRREHASHVISIVPCLTVTARGSTISLQMETRTGAIRLVAFAVAVTLGWSLWASCAGAAMSAPAAQMACCKNGHHSCSHLGTPADCCKTPAPQGTQFTAVDKVAAPPPLPIFTQVSGSPSAALLASSHPSPLSEAWSPPGTKHPTYLRLSILRI
jgi:hypothetical protein